jgi:hypothetical protein
VEWSNTGVPQNRQHAGRAYPLAHQAAKAGPRTQRRARWSAPAEAEAAAELAEDAAAAAAEAPAAAAAEADAPPADAAAAAAAEEPVAADAAAAAAAAPFPLEEAEAAADAAFAEVVAAAAAALAPVKMTAPVHPHVSQNLTEHLTNMSDGINHESCLKISHLPLRTKGISRKLMIHTDQL